VTYRVIQSIFQNYAATHLPLSFLWPTVSGLKNLQKSLVVIHRLLLRLVHHLSHKENALELRIRHRSPKVLVKPVF